MLKRILSVLLACSLLLTVAPAFAAETEETVASEYELLPGAYDIVTKLGICEFEEKEFGDTMTRGEFAKFASILTGYGEGNKNANMFSDVPADHEYAGYINGLAKAGVVSGYRGTGYSPDSNVSMNEAVTTVVRAMGYAAKAEAQGGYPYGSTAVAQRLGLLDNITVSNAAITKAEAIQLAYNALEADAMVAEGLINGEVSYGTYRGYTLGEYVFGMVHLTGVVEAVDISAIMGENLLDSEQILIDGVEILAEEEVLWDYLGYEVDAWYITGKNGINKLVHIEKTDYNKVISVPIADIIDISGAKVTYYDEDGKKDEASYKIAGAVVYNTVATYEAFNKEMIADADGGVVTLVSNDGDKVADVVIVEKYKDYVISALYSSQMTLYDKFDDTKKIKLDVTVDEPYTIIYNSEGKEMSFADLQLGNVISVYDSMDDADQKFIKAVAHTASVEGVVEEVAYVDDVAEVTIDGSAYRLTKRCFTNRKQYLKAGSSVKLILNMEGDACDMVSVSSGLEFAYLMALDETDGLDSSILVKVLKMDGTFSVLKLAENVTVDTNVYKNGYRNGEFILDILKESSKVIFPNPIDTDCIAQPVQIRASEGKLTCIDTVLNSEGEKAQRADIKGLDMLYHVGAVKGSQASTPGPRRGTIYAGKFIAATNTPTISIPSPENADTAKLLLDEEEYSFTTPAKSFPDNSNIRFYADAFSTKEDSFGAEYLITTKAGAGDLGENTYFAVVKDVRRAMINEEEGYSVVLETTSGETKAYFEEDYEFTMGDKEDATPADLKEGDVIRYTTDTKGFVADGMQFCFRASTGEVFTDLHKSGEYANEANSLPYGYVHQSLTDGFTFLEGSKTMEEIEKAASDKFTLANKKGAVVLYDFSEPEGKRIKTATTDDIMGYQAVGEDCSFVYFNANRCTIYITIMPPIHRAAITDREERII